MSLVTQAFVVERYGLRLNAEQLAELFGADGARIPTYTDMGSRFADYRAVAVAIEASMVAGRSARLGLARRLPRGKRPVSRRKPVAWANVAAIEAIYAEARRLTEATGTKHAVDHAIPITGRLVCGLHVETNLQILTKVENSRKRNRFEVK